jgi:cardiolipin synthase A/B
LKIAGRLSLTLSSGTKEALTEIAATLSPQSLEKFLVGLRSDLEKGINRASSRLNTVGLRTLSAGVFSELNGNDFDFGEIAGFARGASAAFELNRSQSSAEFVWTGPKTSQVYPRRSEQVLLDLIREAKSELLLVSFVTINVGNIYEQLNAAIAQSVKVSVLLESSKQRGGRLDKDQVAQMQNIVPNAKFYRWIDRSSEFIDGCVHAKIFVADRSAALITSANLTGNAMEKNMEAGVLVRGGRIPTSVSAHFDELIQRGVIKLSTA